MRRLGRSVKERALSDHDGLLKAGAFSLMIHVALAILLTVTGRSSMTDMSPSVYRVTIRAFSPRGDGGPLGSPVSGSRGSPSSEAVERAKPVEKPRLKEPMKEGVTRTAKKQKTHEQVEGLKRTLKKDDVDKQKSYKLQEALDEIRMKAALDQIQKRVALRTKSEKGTAEGSGSPATGAGSGSGTGTGSGSVGSPTGGSPWGSLSGGSSAFESKLNDYYNLIWSKIKKEWALPGDLPKGKTNLETIIVVVIDRSGKIQKSWFEKKSGNAQYDQTAMRAIKKAEPLPAIPKEFNDETFEFGIRFYPE